MKFKMEVACDNAAFFLDHGDYEVAEFLEERDDSLFKDILRDSNGNKVGSFSLE